MKKLLIILLFLTIWSCKKSDTEPANQTNGVVQNTCKICDVENGRTPTPYDIPGVFTFDTVSVCGSELANLQEWVYYANDSSQLSIDGHIWHLWKHTTNCH